jgi:hypothetical protein
LKILQFLLNLKEKNKIAFNFLCTISGGLGPQSLRGNRFYGKASHHFKKASISLKMYLKPLVIFENPSLKSLLIFTKASHYQTKVFASLKMNLKSLEIFQNVPY